LAKLRYLTISDIVADSWLTAQMKTGFDSGKHPYRVIGGLPEDAKLVDIKLVNDMMYPGKAIMCVFHSESFDDIEDINSLPSMSITVRSYEAVNEKTTDSVTA
jgi:hypothetical protein